MTTVNYWQRTRRQRVSRRALLQASGRAGVGAAGLALVGCGDDDDDEPSGSVAQADQQQQQQQRPCADISGAAGPTTAGADPPAGRTGGAAASRLRSTSRPRPHDDDEQQAVQQAAPATPVRRRLFAIYAAPELGRLRSAQIANLAHPVPGLQRLDGPAGADLTTTCGPVLTLPTLPRCPRFRTRRPTSSASTRARVSGTVIPPRAGACSTRRTRRSNINRQIAGGRRRRRVPTGVFWRAANYQDHGSQGRRHPTQQTLQLKTERARRHLPRNRRTWAIRS